MLRKFFQSSLVFIFINLRSNEYGVKLKLEFRIILAEIYYGIIFSTFMKPAHDIFCGLSVFRIFFHKVSGKIECLALFV